MDFKYERTLRFNVGNHLKGKSYLKPDDERYLLSGRVIVEEKMDGRQMIVDSEKFIFCAEDLEKRRSIAYRIPARFAVFDVVDKDSHLFLQRSDKKEVIRYFLANRAQLPAQLSKGGIFLVPLLEAGNFSVNSLADLLKCGRPSNYAINPATRETSHMEGIVVKPDRYLLILEQLRGKMVRTELIGGAADEQPPEEGAVNEIDRSIFPNGLR
jgi:hypothetical protein